MTTFGTRADVLLFGDLLVDRTIVVETFPRPGEDALILQASEQAGGCCLNVAVALANLGDRPRVVSRLGLDAAGDMVIAYLGRFGIDADLIERDPAWTTGHTYAVVDGSGERTFMTSRPSTGDTYCTDALPPLTSAGVYVAGYALRSPQLAAWIFQQVRSLRSTGATVVFDPGPLIATIPPDAIATMIGLADWCVPNEAELDLIASQIGTQQPAIERMHSLGCRVVVVKRGDRGAEAFAATGHRWSSPAATVSVVDTNGAGDGFVGGLIHGVLHQLGTQQTLELATTYGSLVATISGSHGPFTRAELDALAPRLGPPRSERSADMIDHALGCLIGSAVGDAIGMPASFMTPATIRRVYGRIDDFLDPGVGQLVHRHLAAGQVTDDTEESLLIAEVLIEARGFDEALFIDKMRRWAVDRHMLESTVIGPSTRRFLTSICAGTDHREASKTADTNGSAMRVAPVGIFHHGDVEAAAADGVASSVPSHGSRAALGAAAAIAAAVALAVEGDATPGEVLAAARDAAVTGAAAGYDAPAPSIAVRLDLARDIVDRSDGDSLDEVCVRLYDHIGASMKCYESVPFSLGVFYAARGDFESGLLAAVNIGDDADTNGAIVGALCGAFTGIGGIRTSWADRVRVSTGVDFDDLARRLLRLPRPPSSAT